MNIITKQISQLKRDLKTDAVIVPSKWKRYAAYLAAITGAILTLYSIRDVALPIPAIIGLLLLLLGIIWFLRKTYDYIQQGGQ